VAGAGSADLGGGDLNLNGTGNFNLNGATLNNVGTATVSAGQTLALNNTTFNNLNQFVLQTGTLDMQGINILSGVISGSGIVNGNLEVGAATLAPGFSPGAITINGNLVLSNSSILNIELGGTGAGTFDVLNVLGNATLGGTLNVLPFSGFAPSAGNVFNFMSFAGSSGAFSTINISPSLAGLQFTSGSNFLQLFVPGISPSSFNNLGGFVPANDILIAFDTLNNPLIDSNNDNVVTIEEADESLRQCI
jgi:hypothetical protein